VQCKQGLDLADHLPARAIGIQHLVEKAEERPADAENPVPAVVPLVGLGQKLRGQQRAKELIPVEETLLVEVLDALAEGGQARPPGGEERRAHDKYIYLSWLDGKLKITA